MPIAYPEVLNLKREGQSFSWTNRETMLYALGVGMGADPMDENELPFVYERNLKAMPTLASVVAWGAGPGRMDINGLLVVDGERRITFHKPMPGEAKITADSRVLGVFDKGKDKGAVIVNETVLKDAETGEAIATLVGSTFARGDGGFGGPSEGQPEPHPVPTRAIAIPCIRTRNSRARPAFRGPSCMGCAPMASAAARCCRPMRNTIPPGSNITPPGSPPPCFPGRP